VSRDKKEIQPYWHPDFRIKSTLPDIKVIRTGFIVNFIMVTLLLVVGAYVLRQEYRAYSLGNTIEDLKERIQNAGTANAANLELSERFRNAAKQIAEVEKFYSSPIQAHEFLAELARMKLDDLALTRIAATESIEKKGKRQEIQYHVNISGDVRELTVLDDFKRALEESPLLNPPGYEVEIDEEVQQRDADTGIFPCRISIELRPAQENAKKVKGGKG